MTVRVVRRIRGEREDSCENQDDKRSWRLAFQHLFSRKHLRNSSVRQRRHEHKRHRFVRSFHRPEHGFVRRHSYSTITLRIYERQLRGKYLPQTHRQPESAVSRSAAPLDRRSGGCLSVYLIGFLELSSPDGSMSSRFYG